MIELAPTIFAQLEYDLVFLYTLTLTHNTHKDWRLPTDDEYTSTVDIPQGSWYDDRKLENRYFITPVRDI